MFESARATLLWNRWNTVCITVSAGCSLTRPSPARQSREVKQKVRNSLSVCIYILTRHCSRCFCRNILTMENLKNLLVMKIKQHQQCINHDDTYLPKNSSLQDFLWGTRNLCLLAKVRLLSHAWVLRRPRYHWKSSLSKKFIYDRWMKKTYLFSVSHIL